MSDLIDREHLLSEIVELKKSPWFNEDYLGSKLVRKEAIEIVEDLCIKKSGDFSPLILCSLQIVCMT